MDVTIYNQFLAEQKAGLRKQAKISISRFIESFADQTEMETWTQQFLSTLRPGEVVRHELYEAVIFPVLFAGFERRDAWSLYWLAETERNLSKAPHLLRSIGSPPSEQLFKEAYALAPSSYEIRRGLLRDLLRRFDFMAHEWPSAILYPPEKPWQSQYWELLADIIGARTGFCRRARR
jgi:hypothetical protein